MKKLLFVLFSLFSFVAQAQIVNPVQTRYQLDAGVKVNKYLVTMLPQTDERPAINNLSLYVASYINQYRQTTCTGNVMTPYPTMENVITGVVYTLLPLPAPTDGSPQLYDAKIPGGDYILTVTTYTNPLPYRAKTKTGFVTLTSYCSLVTAQYTP